MNLSKIIKKNIKLYAIMTIIIILGMIGITYAVTIGSFQQIAINTTTSDIVANITYDAGTNSAEIISNGNMLPIDDSLVTGPDVTDARVVKAKFNVAGTTDNPVNTIYDVALYANDIDCDLRTSDLKWRLYKGDTLLSSGTLSPEFDTMANNRLVLTNTQQDLTTTTDKYTFLLWISESCTGDITQCDPTLNQNKYLNKTINASLKIELSTKTNKELTRVTGAEGSCSYTEVAVPACNTLTYTGSSQELISTSNAGYTLINNNGTNAGNYYVTLQLSDSYKWSDGSTDNKAISCKIDKKEIIITTLDQTTKYGTSIYSTTGNVSTEGLLAGNTLSSINLHSSIVEVGTGTISSSNAKILDTDSNDVTSNYNIFYNNLGKVTVNCLNISTMPSVTSTKHTGEEITGVSGGTYITITGDTVATNIGSYTATATPIKNYCWADSTTTVQTLNWSILGDQYIITLDNQEANLIGTGAIYFDNGSICLDDQCATQMTTTTNAISVPSKTGYTFGGYYTAANGSGTQMITNGGYATNSLINTTYTENSTLYAKWTPSEYTVTFDATGGTNGSYGSSTTVTYGKTYNFDSYIPTRDGYTFEGWYSSASGTGTKYSGDFTYNTAGNLTVYANWTGNAYTITYDANGGTGAPANQSYTTGVGATLSSTKPTKTGYTFDSWNTASDGSGDTYDAGGQWAASNYGNKTLYAIWAPTQYTISYTLNGGTVSSNPAIYTIESADFTLNNPSRTGYAFAGWTGTDLSSATETVTVSSGSTGNRSYTANWTANSYNISYDININKTFGSGSYMNTGYKVNWDEDFTIESTINIPSTGSRYFVFGNYDNSTANAFNIEINSSNKLRIYVGTGQVDSTAGTVYASEDITVTFKWSASTNTYTVTAVGTSTNISTSGTYDLSGTPTNALRIGTKDYRTTTSPFGAITVKSFKLPNSQVKTFGQTLTLRSISPSGIVKNFEGWSTSSSATSATYQSGGSYTASIASDTTLYAVWEEQTLINFITNLYTSGSPTQKTQSGSSDKFYYASSVNLMNDNLDGTGTTVSGSNGGNIRYYGASPNNYIDIGDRDSSGNVVLWRIIGVFKNVTLSDGSTATLVKIMRNSSIGSYAWDYTSDGAYNSNWNDSTLQVMLNDAFYNSTSTTYYNATTSGTTVDFSSTGLDSGTTNKIQPVTWSITGYTGNEVYPADMYGYERANSSKIWSGNIALLYPSDYGFASDLTSCGQKLYKYGDYSACYGTNWIHNSTSQWTLTTYSWEGAYSSYGYAISSAGKVFHDYYLNNKLAVRPSVFLKSDLIVESGSGTSTDPYVVRGSEPTCTLSVTTSGITITPSSNVTSFGMSTSSTAVYNNTSSLDLSTGTKYGFVQSATGETGSCSVNITNTIDKKSCADSGYYYHSTWDTCYTYATPTVKSGSCVCASGDTTTTSSSYECSDWCLTYDLGTANVTFTPTSWSCPSGYNQTSAQECSKEGSTVVTTKACSSGTKLNDTYCYG